MRSVVDKAIAFVAVVAFAPVFAVSGVAAAAGSPWTAGTVFIAEQGLHTGYGHLWDLPPGGSPGVLQSGSIQDVAVNAAGDYFWTDCNGFVAEQPAGGSAETLASGYSCPTGIAVDSAGDVFFGAFGGPSGEPAGLYEIPSGGSPELIASGAGEIQSIAIDGNGDIWGADGSDNLVLMPHGTTTLVSVNVPTYGGGINAVRLDDANDLYFSTASGDDAVQLPVGGGAPITYGTGLGYSQGVVVNGSGDVYIGQPGIGEVVEVPAVGSQSVVASGLDSPQGLAVWPPTTPGVRGASSTTLTSSSPSTVTTERSVTVKATVTPAGGLGSVQFSDNGRPIGTPVVTNATGVAKVSTTLPKGSDQVTAAYLGDAANAASPVSNPLSFTATPIKTTTVLSTPGGTTVPGDQPVSVSATVTGHGGTPTGYVEFKLNGKVTGPAELTGTPATATVDISLPPGTSKVSATYEGDSVFAVSNAKPLTFTAIPPYTPSVTATVSYGKTRPNGSESVKIKVEVEGVKGNGNGVPTGTVSADQGFTCGALSPGTGIHTLSATATCSAVVPSGTSEDVLLSYSGDSTYDPGSTTAYVENGGGD
ncbi:MAG: Ig-like domain repeat protein [Acidimicrobiales bacterium]|jgi:hypothetical protein